MITFGSLFAGIGGLDLGLERAGMVCKWQVEIDDYATRVLERHWPNVRRYRDVRECGEHNLDAVDLICGGFPCQDVSLAGKRAGLEGQRTTLWGEFARIIGELRPQWVLAENVPGLLSSDSGRFFGNVLRDLATCGYDAEWDCIPACALGAPHRRDRVFIVGYAKRSGCTLQSSESERAILGHGAEASASSSLQQDVADADWERFTTPRNGYDTPCLFRGGGMPRPEEWWAVEPDVGRVANGVPARVDRLRCLGNAVVPQVAEYVGRLIMRMEALHESS